ncbi:hypothetical protein RFI_38273 [Reticulomyxa filosa]|uniref:Uncharacterized protein n=1 Tax=Reticulomyxa filosa TaxID=46433 RepID=X6LCD2_RETFI|nr:hypothetical protein RFI_38273 [Reticulomyxa filosa]|eukprot:ETN99208.1 hypothetical protein RFI_38273 [Reticulomyxa filosa]
MSSKTWCVFDLNHIMLKSFVALIFALKYSIKFNLWETKKKGWFRSNCCYLIVELFFLNKTFQKKKKRSNKRCCKKNLKFKKIESTINPTKKKVCHNYLAQIKVILFSFLDLTICLMIIQKT